MKKKKIPAETAILDYIEKKFSNQNDSRLVLGPGDDAAVVRMGKSLVVLTTDELIEGTHFKDGINHPELIARKLLRINLSDLAAMGKVRPIACLAGGAFPSNFPPKWVKRFTRALADECRVFGLSLAGGNLARSGVLHVYASVFGKAEGKMIKRSGARSGDLLFNVGPLGDSRAGLEIFLEGRRSLTAVERKLCEKFWRPHPLLEEGKILSKFSLATSMLDNSDGLLRSCEIIAKASGKKVKILLSEDAISPELLKYCRKKNKNWQDYAAGGGEDYGLIFTAERKKAEKVRKLIPAARIVGRVEKGRGVFIENACGKVEIFEHF